MGIAPSSTGPYIMPWSRPYGPTLGMTRDFISASADSQVSNETRLIPCRAGGSFPPGPSPSVAPTSSATVVTPAPSATTNAAVSASRVRPGKSCFMPPGRTPVAIALLVRANTLEISRSHG
jgi:hypothetical protein